MEVVVGHVGSKPLAPIKHRTLDDPSSGCLSGRRMHTAGGHCPRAWALSHATPTLQNTCEELASFHLFFGLHG